MKCCLMELVLLVFSNMLCPPLGEALPFGFSVLSSSASFVIPWTNIIVQTECCSVYFSGCSFTGVACAGLWDFHPRRCLLQF